MKQKLSFTGLIFTFSLFALTGCDKNTPQACLPEEIPMYADAKLVESFATEKSCTAILETTDKAVDVNKFYREALNLSSWQLKVNHWKTNKSVDSTDEDTSQIWIKGNAGFLLDTTEGETTTAIQLNVTKLIEDA